MGSDVPGIWRVPSGGGEETLVLKHHDAGARRFWRLVDEGIYFVTVETESRPAVRFFSLATGAVTPVATLEKPIPFGNSGLSVSPDRRWLLYAQVDESSSDIMLVENFR